MSSTCDRLWAELAGMVGQLHGEVLDAGCGQGDYTVRLRALPGVTRVTPMDLREYDDSCFAPREYFERQVSREDFVQGDVQALPFEDASFDGVLCWRVAQYLEHPERALAEFARVLRPGGVLCMRVPARALDIGPEPPAPGHVIPPDHPAALRPDAFTWRVYWSPRDWVREAAQRDLACTGMQMDCSISAALLFRRA